jgi:hypothetical protein
MAQQPRREPSSYLLLWEPNYKLQISKLDSLLVCFWNSVCRDLLFQMWLFFIMWWNIMVQCLALLLCIWEVSGSCLGLETGYADWDFSWFSIFPPGKCWDSTLN